MNGQYNVETTQGLVMYGWMVKWWIDKEFNSQIMNMYVLYVFLFSYSGR